MSVGAAVQPEHAVGQVVHRRDPAVAGDRQHTGPEVEDQVPEEAVAQHLGRLRRRCRLAGRRGPARATRRSTGAGLAVLADEPLPCPAALRRQS